MTRVRRILVIGALLVTSCRRPREEVPDHLARLRAWRTGAPAFWQSEENGLLPWANDAEADAIFREGSVDGPAFGLGCEIVLHGYSESTYIKGPNSERADLSIKMWLGTDRGRHFLRVEGPDNQNDLRMVFPIAGLRKGDPVVVDVHDRDAIGYSAIDRIEGVLAGPPPFKLVGTAKVAEMSCRPLVAAPFERAFATRELKVKERIAVIARRRPDRMLADLGLPRTHEHDGRDAVIELAPYVGWDDPRMKAIVASLVTAERAASDALRTFVVEERARVGSQVTLEDGFVVRARRVQDEPPEIELDVRNTAKAEAVLGAPFHGLAAFGVDGTRTEIFPDESTYDLRVQPGASVTLHYRAAVGAGAVRPTGPTLLRAHRREVVLGLDRPFVSPVTNVKITGQLACDGKRPCFLRVSSEDLALGDLSQGFRIDPRVRGRRDGTEWRPGEWTFREKDLVPDDITLSFERRDPRAEIPWSVATDR